MQRASKRLVLAALVCSALSVTAGRARALEYAWVEAEPATRPAARCYHAMAWDPVGAQVLMFGGMPDEQFLLLGDTWLWDGTSWKKSATDGTGPTPRYGHAMALDEGRNRIVLFGGWTMGDPQKPPPLSDVWEWDGTAWHEVWPSDATGGPHARGEAAMAYDPSRKAVVIFGGGTGYGELDSELGDAWAWDGKAWTQLSEGPGARRARIMFWDPSASGLAMHGGWTLSGPPMAFEDAWLLKGGTWSSLGTQEAAKRFHPAFAWDSIRQRAVMIGGSAVMGDNLLGTWEWDGSAWTKHVLTPSPDDRSAAAMAYDRARATMVLFGGNRVMDDLDDTWLLTVLGQTCTAPADCPQGHCVDGVCCEDACDAPCHQCNAAGHEGHCMSLANAQDPDTCSGNKTCNELGACGLLPGKACVAADDCASGDCGAGFCCAGECATGHCEKDTGKCLAGSVCDGDHTVEILGQGAMDCSPYRCVPEGKCRETCSFAGDCIETHTCSVEGKCVPRGAAEPGSGADSGCTLAWRGSAARGALLLIAGLVAGVVRRRRRASRLQMRSRA